MLALNYILFAVNCIMALLMISLGVYGTALINIACAAFVAYQITVAESEDSNEL